MNLKRILSFLLAFAILFSLLPAVFAADGAERANKTDPTVIDDEAYDIITEDIWDDINALEDQQIRPLRGETPDAADYAALTDEVIALVEASDTYKEGTLTVNGEHITWETTLGVTCGYSPSLRARVKESSMNPSEEELAASAGIITSSYAVKGGSPNSVNVAVFQPYYDIDESFTTKYKTEGQRIAKATGGTSTTYLTTDATINNIANALETCGVVIFDSHGDTDYASGDDYTSRANTSYLCLQSGTGLTTADQQRVTGTYGSYYHAYYAGSYEKMKYYCVDGTAIANHMDKSAPNNILWSAICLGMATKGLHEPLRAKGVEVAYGYSQSVSFDGDYLYEEAFWDAMIEGHTVAEAIAEMKSTYGYWDYSSKMQSSLGGPSSWYFSTYSQAVANYAAFPIVVSGEDVYPGQGNVDNYQTVNSTWKLHSACAHNGETTTTTQPATCTEAGWTKVVCDICGETLSTTTIPALGHNFGTWTSDNAGHHTKTCSRCRTTETENCTYTTVVTPPTETESGYTTYTCKECGYQYTGNYTEPTGCTHKNAREVAAVAPTCTEPGNIAYWYCPDCETYFKDATFTTKITQADTVLAATGHKPVTDAAVEPTCVKTGLTEGSHCSVCGTVLVAQETVPMTDHTWGDWTVSKAATCTAAGEETRTCSGCGEEEVREITALGHDWDEGEVTTPPTETENGVRTYTCRRCKETKTEPIPNLNHTHTWGDWTVSKAATCTAAGEETRTCSGCSEKETREVKALGHDYQNGVCTRCGEKEPEGSCDGGEGCPGHDMTDIPSPSDWAHAGIDYALKNGLMQGTGNGKFEPDTVTTRAMIVTVLWRQAGEEKGHENTFSDVPDGEWYTDAVAWAAANDIVNGTGNGKFEPAGDVTREQMVTILYRYCGDQGIDTSKTADLTSFPDAGQVNDYALDAMRWAVAEGIINGKVLDASGATYLQPLGNASRAEIATILMRFIENILK